MGRKPLPKSRSLNADKRSAWLKIIMPHFSKTGFSGVRMDELSTIVGVSKATFYKHFISKGDLIQALLKWKMDEISKFIPLVNDDSISYYERYMKSSEMTCIAISGLSNVFLSDLKNEFPEMFEQIELFRTELIKHLERFYYQCQKDGFIKSEVDIKTLVMTEDIVYEMAASPEFLIRYDISLDEYLVKYIHFRSMAVLANYNEDASLFFKNLLGKLS